MAIIIDPNIASSGLAFSIDAANMRSYSGIGTVIYDLCSGLGGTLFNGVTYSQTPSPYFDFDGTNDYIGFPKLDVLNGCIDENNPRRFEDITAGEFLNERLEDALLAKMGDEAYKEYIESGEEGISYDEIRKEFNLDKHS